jgi:glycosyltransferase involved in cell wall biosynthesis
LEEQFVLTVFGFVPRRKGHGTALEALALLPANCRLLLAGGRHPDDHTEYVEELRRQAAALGVDGRVSFTGYLEDEDVTNIMSATDLVLAPFTSGSGSGSLALAFACGKPVLASAIPPNIEISKLCPGAVGLVPPEQPAELAAAIARLRRDPRSLTQLAEGSRRYAAKYTYAHMAGLTATVYNRAARGPVG